MKKNGKEMIKKTKNNREIRTAEKEKWKIMKLIEVNDRKKKDWKIWERRKLIKS